MTKANPERGKASKAKAPATTEKAALSERELDAATGGAPSSAPSVSEIVVTKPTDASSTNLYR